MVHVGAHSVRDVVLLDVVVYGSGVQVGDASGVLFPSSWGLTSAPEPAARRPVGSSTTTPLSASPPGMVPFSASASDAVLRTVR